VEVVPNYKVVIGASYDDFTAAKGHVEEDFDELQEDDTNVDKAKLYDLCIKEVPTYLRKELCETLQEKDNLEAKDSKQIRSNQTLENEKLEVSVSTVTEKSVVVATTESNRREDNFSYLGIPLELPVEVKKKSTENSHIQVNYLPASEASGELRKIIRLVFLVEWRPSVMSIFGLNRDQRC